LWNVPTHHKQLALNRPGSPGLCYSRGAIPGGSCHPRELWVITDDADDYAPNTSTDVGMGPAVVPTFRCKTGPVYVVHDFVY